ncbi:right-handed parallel beta-helix repeat-containing protein [Saccharicrinis aurantiacus]|uniref:right-handed parallel beta-helix repeat-containing protein n=1 Tax=Saccharicrinis aurantiacus TaxID=1849719 RepID=UPI0024920C53|nr:right-handed parallel beta-helix repeat-containing protein [Saccharicrinis aurantiacus]
MKNTSLFWIVAFILINACSIEQIIPDDDILNDSSNENLGDEDNLDDIAYTPCDFDFNTVEINDTLNIKCSHDLKGEDIIIPSSVVINYYSGGEITNGTLIFNEQGQIDGRLLNYDLEVEGDAKLLNTTFQFNKDNWQITEGRVTDEVAIFNKKSIQKAIDDSKRLGANTFNIGKLDAYFNVTYDYYRKAAITLHNNFTLQMNDDTNIRVQPNGKPRYVLFQIREVVNVKILGGNFYGDRDEHDYSSTNKLDGAYTWEDTHEGGNLVGITASQDILVEGSVLEYSTGDGLTVGCLGTYTSIGNGMTYTQSSDITISNCTFDSNRRNGISPGDGVRVTIDSNKFLNSGVDTENSKGIAPRCAIDVESWWGLDDNKNLIRYHTTQDFVISNNIERGGANISFTVAIGENVTIENNDVQQRMGFNTGRNITIRNNKVASQIFIGNGAYRTYHENNEVYGNTIQSDTIGGIGIFFQAFNAKVYNNKIIGKTTAMAIRNCGNSEIYDNHIELPKDRYVTYGIYAYGAVANNLKVYNNKIFNCAYMPISFSGINNIEGGEDKYVLISDNFLDGIQMSKKEVERHIYNSKGIIVN